MENNYILLVAILLNCYCLFGGADPSVCSRGEKLLHLTGTASDDVCVPCDYWTFMDEDNHSHTECKRCTFIEDPDVEVFASRCNKTHDTVILCNYGFYRRRARNDIEVDICQECTQCAHAIKVCQDYNDTVCCHPSQDTVMTSSGVFVCQERPVVCGPGQFFSTSTKECLSCPSWDTFMDDDNHSHTACNLCTLIEDPDVEVLISLCNKTHDSVILCKDGFYRRKARNDRQKDRCEECTYCPDPTRACQGYQDTVCCRPSQDAVMTSSGVFVYEDRPVVCGPGQFFSTSTEECLPCPAGTFMSAHNHTYKECLKCEQLSENNANHAIITRPCSRTAPTLFGCKDGYFRDPTQESLQTEVSCTPCRSCDRSLVDCGMFHDAVCDIKEEIVVVTGSASGYENEHRKRCMERGTQNDDAISVVVELTSQSNNISLEYPSFTGHLKTRDVWLYVLIFVIVLLLSNVLLLSILFRIVSFKPRQCNLKPDNAYKNTGCILFRVKHIDKNYLLCMTVLGLITLFLHAASLVTLAVTNTRDEQELEAVIVAIILSTVVIISFIIIYIIFFNIIKADIKYSLDVVKNKEAEKLLACSLKQTTAWHVQDEQPMCVL